AAGFTDVTCTFCQAGRGNLVLTPPPLAPPPFWVKVRRPGASHQGTSCGLTPGGLNCVPPTDSTNGLAAGKSTCARLPDMPSPLPSSPDETQTVMPCIAAICSRWLIAVSAAADQLLESSAPPQLTDSVTGMPCAAPVTVSSRSTQP